MLKSTTLILILICLIFFFLESAPGFIEAFYFIPSEAFERPWTFVTSIFLHAGFEHLFFNMFGLFMFGLYLERRISRRDYILIFLLAGIVGNFGYMLTAFDKNIPAVGASGAIYGIMGCLAVLEPYAMVYVGYLPMPMIAAAFFWAFIEFIGIFIPSNIAHGSHLFGLIVGIGFGIYLRTRIKKTYKEELNTYFG